MSAWIPPRFLLPAVLWSAAVLLGIGVVGWAVWEWCTPVFQQASATPSESSSDFSNPSRVDRTGDLAAASQTAPQSSAAELRIRALAEFATGTERMELIRLLEAHGASGETAIPLLKEFLRHGDQAVRRATLRGIAATQSGKGLEILRPFLVDGVPVEESTEAALALATMNLAETTPVLMAALETSREPVLREHLVDALVSRPTEESAPFISSFLGRPEIPVEEKQNLLRMSGLNNTITDQALAAWMDSPEESLRLGAFQGLSMVSESRQSDRLVAKLSLESDSENRALIYEAWGNQMDANPSQLAKFADSEADPAVRLRALKAWTESGARQNLALASDSSSQARLEELRDMALAHPDFGERRVALFSLGNLRQEPAVQTFLEEIARESGSEKIRALALGLLRNAEN